MEGLEGLEGFGGCLEGLEGFGGFGSFGAFGVFARWQTAALKANRKPLLWPWPWGACSEVALALGCLLGTVFGGFGRFWQFGAFAGGQTAALKAHRKPFWMVLEGLECLRAGKRQF